MKIDYFKDVHIIGPWDWDASQHNVNDYAVPSGKSEFYTTKYAEYDFSVPKSFEDGLFIELGVFKGRSIKYLGKNWPQFHWYGFDTFEGVNEIWEMGGKQIDMNRFHTDIPIVPENVTLIKGMFQDTLLDWANYADQKIGYINMDADIYSATAYALDVLNPWIVKGTIIRFDELSDWRILGYESNQEIMKLPPDTKYTKWKEGEWKALLEWLKQYDREVVPLWRNWHQSAGVIVTK